MSTAKPISRKRGSETVIKKSDSKRQVVDDFDPDLSSDLKGIMSALQQIREKAQKDGQKKKEETISSVASEIKSSFDAMKSKLEKDRQSLAKALSKSAKECESCLKNETARFQETYEKFCQEKDSRLQVLKDTISKFDEDKERLFMRYEQLKKKEKSLISEQQKWCSDKIAKLEESVKKKQQDNKTFSILRKTLGSFLETGSEEEEEFAADD